MAFSLREDTMPNSCQKSDVRVLESPSLSTHNDFFPGYSPNTTHAPIPSFKAQKIHYYAMPQ